MANTYEATRLRGLVGSSLGEVNLFGSFGWTRLDLGSSSVADGINLGFGADYGLTDAASLRFEMVFDDVPDFGPDLTSLRMGVAFGF